MYYRFFNIWDFSGQMANTSQWSSGDYEESLPSSHVTGIPKSDIIPKCDSFIIFEDSGTGTDLNSLTSPETLESTNHCVNSDTSNPGISFYKPSQNESSDSDSSEMELLYNDSGSGGDLFNCDDASSFVVFDNTEKKLPYKSNKPEKPKDLALDSCMYLYIQMELCKAKPLSDWLNDNKSEVRDRLHVLQMFYQIVSAVQYVHSEGLMHRDLKVGSLLLSEAHTKRWRKNCPSFKISSPRFKSLLQFPT